MDENNLPLLELFTRLREAGLPLGIDEYQSVLQALQAGFGISDKAALKRLCQTLWVKSAEERQLFEYHFEQIINSEAVLTSETSPKPFWQRKIFQILPYMILGILSLGIVLTFQFISKQRTQTANPTPTIQPIATLNPQPNKIPTPTAQPTTTPDSNINTDQPNLIFWTLLLAIALNGGYIIFRG